MTELKTCPFCGGKAELMHKFMFVNGYRGDAVRVRCSQCYAQSPYKRNAIMHGFHKTEEAAVEAWNRRADNG